MKYQKINNFTPPRQHKITSNFKIGDKVKIIGGNYIGDIRRGNIAQVISVSNSHLWVAKNTERVAFPFYPHEIERVE